MPAGPGVTAKTKNKTEDENTQNEKAYTGGWCGGSVVWDLLACINVRVPVEGASASTHR